MEVQASLTSFLIAMFLMFLPDTVGLYPGIVKISTIRANFASAKSYYTMHPITFSNIQTSTLLPLLLALVFTTGMAQTPVQLTDYVETDLSSDPEDLTPYGDGFLIRVNDGRVLYYDIQNRTYQKVINDATGNSLTAGSSDDYEGLFPVLYEGRIYFSAEDPDAGPGLFVYDGNEAYMIAPIQPSDYNYDFGRGARVVYNGLLYAMISPDPSIGLELYAIDPNDNVDLVADMTPGIEGSYVEEFAVLGDQLIISLYSIMYGQELWSINNGDEPKLLADIRVGSASSNPGEFTVINDKLVFAANDGINGEELWVYDGSVVSILKDINVGIGGSSPELFINIEGEVYFHANRGLYKTDGTEAGTILLTSENIFIRNIFEFKKRTYFTAGFELWRSDGTIAGTEEIDNIGGTKTVLPLENVILIFKNSGDLRTSDGTASTLLNVPAPEDLMFSSNIKVWAVEGYAFFEAQAASTGNELWQYDPAGTVSLTANFNETTDGLSSQVVHDEEYIYYLYDSTLYSTDGTTQGASMITTFSGENRNYTLVTYWQGDIYLMGDISDGGPEDKESALFRYTPQTGETVVIDSLLSASRDQEIVLLDDRFYMIGSEYIYEVNGTPGASVLFDMSSSILTDYFVWNGDLYHSNRLSSNPDRFSLFKNGEVLYDFSGNTSNQGRPTNFTPYNGKLYFTASTPAEGRELWVTDGTEQGTKIVIDFFVSNQAVSWPMIATPDYLMYGVFDNGNSYLMRSDGTVAGTVALSSNTPFSSPVLFQGKVYFSSFESNGSNLWTTDGTSAGTMRVADINTSDPTSRVFNLHVFEERIYFSGSDNTNGTELWASDGSEESTTLVTDLYPGIKSSSPGDFQVFKGSLIFMARTPSTDDELFIFSECQGAVTLSCASPPCDLSSSIIRSSALIDIQSAQQIPSNQHVTMVSADGLEVNSELTVGTDGTLSVAIGACEE